MCGFVLSVNDSFRSLDQAMQDLRHRGPDSTGALESGAVRCGFVRLAIVDPNTRADQPMLDRTGKYTLLFNGEIYNFRELRSGLTSRGERFVTESDTEVLLAGLLSEGPQFLKRVNGIYAFALCDLETGQIQLGRDPFGVKPLYFSLAGTRAYVCSEVRPLAKLLNKSPDNESLAHYGSFGYVARGSIFQDIEELAPNTFLTISGGKVADSSAIVRFTFSGEEEPDFEKIQQLLDTSIQEQVPEVPFGVLYSGGLDSTLVLDRCVASPELAGVYSVIVDDPVMSERTWQDQGLSTLRVDQRRVRRIAIGPDKFGVRFIEGISAGMDYPLFHPNFVGAMLIAAEARSDGIKVLLSGEGADEVFRGYKWFYQECSASEYMEYVPYESLSRILGVAPSRQSYDPDISKAELFQRHYIRRWLLRQDLTGMANSIEVRVPFLSLPLVQHMNSLSNRTFGTADDAKWPIKKMLRERFGDEFVSRRKVGFDFPLNSWITSGHVDYLVEEGVGLIDVAALHEALTALEGSYLRNRLIFSLVSLVAWHKALGDRGHQH